MEFAAAVPHAIVVDVNCRNILGESPVWDERQQVLYWVNIHAAELWAWQSGLPAKTVKLPQRVGAIGLRDKGGLVLALEAGFALVDRFGGELHTVRHVDMPAHTRMNDGRVDPVGRFLCGGMNEQTPQSSNAALYSLEADGRVAMLLDGIGCANSLCWSPDGRTMYFSDMPTGRIDAFDYDIRRGTISNRRTFATLALPGAPDGSIVDAEGHLWNAQWGGGKLVRYRPDGSVEREVPLPVSNPSCVAFGGPELDILYVTSAWFTLDDATRARESHAGSLFAFRPGVKGLPSARFAG